jgi:hypothetical protein
MYGIYESCGANATLSYYHNTVRISGTVTSGSDTTYAFMRAQPSGSPASFSMKNNIFENARTGGTGKHLAISNNSTHGTNWSSNYQNYNIENAADPSAVGQWLMGQPVLNFSNWKTNSNVDPNSKSGITLYFNPVDMSNGIYHLTGASLGDKNLTGTPLGTVLTDFDGQLRHPIYPYIGADEDTTARLFILINFHAFLEGLMNQTNTAMTPDTVTLKLCLGSAPFTVVDSATGMLDANGNGTFYFRGSSYIDSAYYVVLTHRNSIQTWTASPNSFLNSTLTYDLASSANQAYGSNLIQKGSYYCVYTGDVNQDGFVDFSDLVAVDNDSYNYTTGYVVTDLNGDDFVDFTDLAMCDNNSYNYIGIAAPGFAKVHYTRPAKHYTPIAR